MDVLYTCDNNYVWLMGISTISLFENNKHIESLNVYLLGENISEENKIHLESISSKYGRRIIIIEVPKLDIPSLLVSKRWPISAFTRLYSGMLLPNNLRRVLYLDCDTIITGNIEPLQSIQFEDNIVLGVKDCISGTYKKNIGLEKRDPYYNAGVILIDLEKLRKINISIEIEKYMSQYIKYINYADQDILNGMFKGKIGTLNPMYDVMTLDVEYDYEDILRLRRPTNFYSKTEVSNAITNPIIIHYTTNMLVIRPWFCNSDHPLKCEFEKYWKLSVWKDVELNEMIFSSNESKAISLINKLPKSVSYFILGLIHSELKPLYIRFKAKRM